MFINKKNLHRIYIKKHCVFIILISIILISKNSWSIKNPNIYFIKNFAIDLKNKLKSNSSRVAISYIYDAKTFDITAYGNLWRDRITEVLSNQKIRIVSRKDLWVLLEDIESFEETKDLTENLNAEIIVMGAYYIKSSNKTFKIEMTLKAINTKSLEILVSKNFEILVPPQNLILLTQVIGNIRKNKMEKLNDTSIFLKATLNKACFVSGEKAYITINTQPGVYVYIFNIAADGSVTRIFPNTIFRQRPLSVAKFIFPPKNMDDLSLIITAYPNIDPAYESFRVIVSKHPLREQGFPIPQDQIIIGEKARTIKDLLHLVGNNKDIAVKDLPYLVGNTCKK